MDRRTFLSHSAAAAATLALRPHLAGAAENSDLAPVRVAVVGLGRGLDHVRALVQLANVEITHVAEVDPNRLAAGLKLISEKQKAECKGVIDFRTFLGEKELDAVFIALPNFWHTPAALLCLQAGKHVYVEKPGSQNPREAELLVEAARRSGRQVGMGNQRRTWMRDGIAALHGGAIGTLRSARAFYDNARGPIGQGKNAAAPGLNMDLWQGPVASDREMKPYVHYDWHWLWNWGNGELGNNGVHTLDVLRWGLGVDYPLRVTYTGGRYWYADQQQTPDTGTAVFDCGHVGFSWEQSSCHPRTAEKPLGECVFYGDGGTLALTRNKYTIYDSKGAKVSETDGSGVGGDIAHIGNFIGAVRGLEELNSPIEEGQKSAMLCHLGNLAYRTASTIHFDPIAAKLVNHPEAQKLWRRETYRPGWEPKGV